MAKMIVKVSEVQVGDKIHGAEVTRVEVCQAWYEKGCLRFHFGNSGSLRRSLKEPTHEDIEQTIEVER